MASPRGCGGGGGGLLAAAILFCGLLSRGVASSSSGEGSPGGGGMLRGVVVGGEMKDVPASRELADSGEPRSTWNGCKCKQTWSLEDVGACENYCCNPDSDTLGEWCQVEDVSCEDSDWGYCKPPGLDSSKCQDTLPGWMDAEQDTCADYALFKWCTKDGEVGSGWDKSWGSFADFANQGHSADSACCTCGGGVEAGQKCHDKDWTDKDGDSCATYGEAAWCNLMGGYGVGWHEEWGTFKDLSDKGMTAVDACCTCGGGVYSARPQAGAATSVTLLGCECQEGWQDQITGKICTGHCCNPDGDPNGDWCMVKDRLCEDAEWGYCRETAPVDEPCVDSPAAWLDAYGYDCSDYEAQQFCTSSGGYGTGWKADWGTFDDFFNDGHNARTACCACGGGGSRDDLEEFDKSCQDKIGWNDTDGDKCASYFDDQWCTSTGGYGMGWHEEWGTFADHSKDFSAPQACCACGGGSTRNFQAHPNAKGLTRSPTLGVGAPSPPASSMPDYVRQTWNGCDCKKDWNLEGMSCQGYCCNPDNDEFGNWCVVEDAQCEESDWGYCLPLGGNTEHNHGMCRDLEGWIDMEGDGCWSYEDKKWCKGDGTAGSGWDTAWGMPDDYFHEGHSAFTACCACGGGNRGGGAGFGDDDDEFAGAQRAPEPEKEMCKDVPDWKDPEGDGCAAYERSRWCSPTGGFGIGWHEEWGNFRGNTTALKACCYCGGGSTSGYSWNEMVAAAAKAKAAAAERSRVVPRKKKGSFGGAAVAVALAVLGVGGAAGIGGYILYKRSKENPDDEDGVGPRSIGRPTDL